MIYIAIEATSIISYILIAFFKNDVFSSEAGLKYFLFGALSTGIMLYGVSLIYGLTGSLNIIAIAQALQTGHVYLPVFILRWSLFLPGSVLNVPWPLFIWRLPMHIRARPHRSVFFCP